MPQPQPAALTWLLPTSRFQTEQRSGLVTRGVLVSGENSMPHLHLFTHYVHGHLVRVDAGQVAHYPRSLIELRHYYNVRAFTFTPFRSHEYGGESLYFALTA